MKQKSKKEVSAQKDAKRKTVYPLICMSNFKAFLFATMLIAVYTTYQKLCAFIFLTEGWHLLDHFMRILTNHISHHPRSLERNMCFNFMPCFFDEFICWLVLERAPSKEILFFRIVTVAAMSYWVQNHVTDKSFKKHAEDWTYLNIFYFTSYAL